MAKGSVPFDKIGAMPVGPGSHASHGAGQAVSAVPVSIPIAGQLIASAWGKIDFEADTEHGDDEDAAYAIGRRDGFSEAIQLLDMLTGGDGEYRYCLGLEDSERHCPTPAEMGDRIIARRTTIIDAGRELVTTLHGFVMQGCPVCGGDCASANPPVVGCPMQNATATVRRWNVASGTSASGQDAQRLEGEAPQARPGGDAETSLTQSQDKDHEPR